MIIIERTTAVFDKIIKDLQRLSFWITIIVQVFFFGLYGFKIYINIYQTFFLVIYCVLMAVSLFGFIFYLRTYRMRKHKIIIETKLGLRALRYLANAIMIVVVIIEFVQSGATDLDIILSALSVASFVFQLMFELLRSAYNKYSELISTSLKMDFAKFEMLKDPKGYFLSTVNAPLEMISNKITGTVKPKKELTKIEQYVEQLNSEYKKQQKDDKVLRANNEKWEIKKNFNIVLGAFKKKDQKKASPPTDNNPPKQIAQKKSSLGKKTIKSE